ncbi:PREDICTED: zonadhesin [Odobenus rosmarus divergens]|uniref:Zonadhesin n=1 Tax=Odobenus rosmarus divergens TaxID=9708 RepID=A0A9B0GGY6_ODORO
MAPPVWTLVLLVGAAWGRGHIPAPVRKEKPTDWKAAARSSKDNSILTQCDFEDDSKPLCDWTQVSTDDGDWIRTSGPPPTGSTGPPGGYPNGEGYYLHMNSSTFHRGGVARLRSPPIWEQGPLCVHFAYHMFGLSWGAQLRLLLLRDTKKKHPSLLWKHINTQSPSWTPTTVTVPMGLVLPSRVVFEGVRGSTAYLDISLDAISIHRGSCNRICMMQTCSFDVPNDLCGWSWIPTASGAKWVQKKGSSGVPNVWPEDFSSPGSGFYMLLDPKNAKPGQKSVLLSPLSHSSGCLSLSFHYILHGQSPGAALTVYASVLGSIRKHTLFSGQPGPNWQPVSVNYTGQGQIQFTLVGVFGETPEPAVAVDAISTAPCGESFPQCDFEDDAHPFCDWAQALGDGGRWTRGNKNMHIQGAGAFEGHYIYVEADKFSKAGQSFRLVSRPFCAPGAICVEFPYHMYGLGEGTKLNLLLESPAGSAPSTLWHRVGSQSPSWLNTSVTIPLGHQQPMQLILEAIRGTHSAFVVAVGFILINHGTCREKPVALTEKPITPTEKPTVPSEIATVSTKKPIVPSEMSTVSPEKSTFPTEKLTIPTQKPTIPTEKPKVPTEKPTLPTEEPTIPTEKPTFPTEETTVPSEENTVPPEETTVPPEETTLPPEEPTVFTEESTIPAEESTASAEESVVPIEETTVPLEEPTIPTEKPTMPTERTTISTEKPTIPAEKPTVHTERTTIPIEKPTIPTEKPTVHIEKPMVPTERTTVTTERPIVPTEKPTIPTEKTTIPTEKPTIPTEKPTVPTERSTVPTEKFTVPTAKPTIPTEKPTIPTAKPTIPTERSTVPTGKPTIPTGKPTIPTGKPTVPTGKPTIPTEKLTVPTAKPTIAKEKPTVPTGKPTIPTERPTIPTEKTTISTKKTPVPTKSPTIPAEKPTVPTEKTTILAERPTIPTEKTTMPTEKPTVLTKRPTIPTEKPTVPTKKTTIPTEKPIIPTEKSTVPTEKLTIPTEKSTVPTERHTVPTTPQPSPTLVPIGPTVLVMPPTATPSTSMTTTTPRRTPAGCPPNAHYEPCACPASCERPKPNCGPLCKPGCVCNSGFLFHESRCIHPSSCNCFYNNNYYKPGAEWFSSNCTERCRCKPGSRMECQIFHCGTHTVCQLKNGQYGCQPYGRATCVVYGDPHQITFDGRHFSFMGKCTYILAQPCGNSTEPFFRVAAKNEGRGEESISSLSKIYVTLPKVTITLLGGRRVLVGGQQVTLPAIPSKGIFLASSGRFVELQTVFGLRVRWDGDQQLYMSVPSTYSRKLCGFCGNYDGDGSNDNQKPDGSPAQDVEELGKSWQTAGGEDKECQRNPTNPPSCNRGFLNSLSALEVCGRLVNTHGAFEACLPHLEASLFLKNCVFDMCKFQRLQSVLCAHMAALTEICQDAGYAVKPWRGPQFCPLTCPPNSRYTLCAGLCPATCHPSFSGMSCQNRCVEGCECNPGFVLSGLQCVPRSQCGCFDPTVGYFKVGEQWFKPGCRQLCVCEGNGKVHCMQWRCRAQEVCRQQDGTYGCHAQGTATCSVSGDPYYLTFDGALHHFMGTCAYILTRPCQSRSLENYFIVSTTNEFRSGNLEASYVRAVNVQVFNLRISLIKGHKVMLNGRRVALPLWPAQGRVIIRPSGSFILLYTDFGLQVRYDGNHLVEVTVPSSYTGRLCGLCGNHNNNSLDDSLLPSKRPTASSVHLGVAWKLPEYSEPGCFVEGGKPSRCLENKEANNWEKNCDILMNPRGPFSQCHGVVPPQSSFASCVYGQCGTTGDSLTLCRSLQAYASLCAHAGQALTWRNSSFCPLKCPPGSSYSPCANPCPVTCLSLDTPKDCPAGLPCTEGCECQKGHILSGTSCVPFSQCGCTHQDGSYHPVGESWYTDNTCSRLCTCSANSNISCHQSTCKPGRLCWPLDGLLRCRQAGMGVCRTSDRSPYVTFDGARHTIWDTCTYVLVKLCHPTMDLPFFKISGKHGRLRGRSTAFYLRRVNIDISDTRVTLGKDHHVLINGTRVTLPSTTQIRGVRIIASGIYTVLNVNVGLQVKFDGKGFLEVQLPTAYYQKVCGLCGNFNDEEEDELMMPSDELAQNDTELVASWQDRANDPKCQPDDQKIQTETREKPNTNCRKADLARAQEQCQTAFQAPAWAKCASHMVLRPFLLSCTNNLCQFGGLNRTLCESLESFGAACRAQGLKPPIWRNSSFCPLECPAHSSYSTCLPSCPPSCLDLTGRCSGPKVPSTCKEGCLCQPGYMLSGQQCVHRAQCGCTDDYGSSFPDGKTWISIRCTRSCTCTTGTIHCQPFRCPPGSHCEPQPGGTGGCEINKSEQCSIYGDPHYRTFDGLTYVFRGRMTYTLIKTIGKLPAGVVPLVVEGRNKVYSSWRPIYLHEIIVIIYGYTVQLKAHLELVVNNQKMGIPYKPSDRLQVALRGHRLYLITDFEMVVTFDGGKNAVITLPNQYKGLVRGLCGNFDGNKRNDFMLPNGTVTQNLVGFGNSWEVQRIKGGDLARFSRAIPEEEGKESGFPVSECSPEQLELINSTQACGVLVDPQGPFAACHQTVAPEPFQEHCVLDLCAAGSPREQEELRCQVLSGYAIICQEAGATLTSWRDHTHCEGPCLRNPCQNDGRCWEQGTHFTCECEPGYGGHLCAEPRDVPPPGKAASNFVAVLLGMLVLVVVLVPTVTRECVSRKRRRRRKDCTVRLHGNPGLVEGDPEDADISNDEIYHWVQAKDGECGFFQRANRL